MSIVFARYFEKLTSITGAAERIIAAASLPECALLKGRIADARERTVSGAPLRLALIGEFSAGKSSLVGALTGAEVVIDADVCTAASGEYAWQGAVLVDTPGIQAEGEETDLRQSRISALTEGIDRFVDDAGTLGRLTAPL